MDKSKKFNPKKPAIAIASALLSLSMLFTVACSDGNDSTSSSSSSGETKVVQTDYQTITNGDFQFGTNGEDVKYPVGSGISWTRSNSSLANTTSTSSSASSGIIDTSDEAYETLFKDAKHVPTENPRTPYYYGLISDDDIYEYDENDRSANSEDKLPTKGSKILMIDNYSADTDAKGCAQYFRSTTSFTVASYGKVSLYVKTDKLRTLASTDEFGAYIRLDNDAGESKSPLYVKNINTNGEWVKYEFYIQASDYATSKFKVYLGLGEGSRTISDGYVEGFAFFDNVNYEDITREEYEAGKQKAAVLGTETTLFTENTDGTIENASEKTFKKNAADFVKTIAVKDNGNASEKYVGDTELANRLSTYALSISHSLTEQFAKTVSVELTSFNLNDVWKGADGKTEYENAHDWMITEASSVAEAATKTSTDLTAPAGLADETTIAFNNKGTFGKSTNATVKINSGKIEKGYYYLLTFYTKVDVKKGQKNGLTVNLVETDATGKLVASTKEKSETAVLSNVTMSDYDDDTYNGWARTQVFIDNRLDDQDRYYYLSVDFGTTSDVTDKKDLTLGTAFLTGFTLTRMSEDELSLATTSGSYTASVTLGKDLPNGLDDDENTDSYAFSYGAGTFGDLVIKTKPVSAIGYKGVPGGHVVVGGETTSYDKDGIFAGLINTRYLANYTGLGLTESDVADLGKYSDKNEYIQPLAIKTDSVNKTYGFVGNSRTFSSGTSTLVSVKVKVYDNAKAYVYLVEADQLGEYGVFTPTGEAHDNQSEVKKQLVQVVDKNTEARSDGWVTVSFVVTAGNEDISYRIELFNGSRDGKDTAYGTVLFDDVKVETANVSEIKETNADYEKTEITYTRKPTKIYSDDEKKNQTGTKTYEATEFVTEYAKTKTMIVNLEAIYADDYEIKKDEDSSSSSSSSSSTESSETSFSLPLQIVSIVISALMIIAIIIIIVRKIIGEKKRKNQAAQIFYSRDSRDANQAAIRANKTKREAAAKKASEEQSSAPAEEKPYDYDNPENNLDEEETDKVEKNTDSTEETAKSDDNGSEDNA